MENQEINHKPDDETWLSVEEAAVELEVSQPTLYRMIREGNHPPFTYIGKRKKFLLSNLKKWRLDGQNKNA